MATGLEGIPDKTLITIAADIKSGIHRVLQMSEEEQKRSNGHDVPPGEWAKTVLMMLFPFKNEIESRGLDYTTVGPDISQYENAWAEVHFKEN